MQEPDEDDRAVFEGEAQAIVTYSGAVVPPTALHPLDVPHLRDACALLQFLESLIESVYEVRVSYSSEVALESAMAPNLHSDPAEVP